MSTKIGGMVIKKGLVGGEVKAARGQTRLLAAAHGPKGDDTKRMLKGEGGVEKGERGGVGSSQRYGLWDFNLIKQFVTEYGTRQ